MSVDEIVSYLKEEGHMIGIAAEKGNEKAKAVIRAYDLLQKCPGDEVARTLTDFALVDWKKDKANREDAALALDAVNQID